MTASEKQPPNLVVGIGASAGGLAAFKGFLSKMPADTGMAFVLVQHLDPHHKSLLVELLGAQSPIPVVAARDGLAVKENCVFVIPPDATLTITDGILQLVTPAPAREHRRPIDTFLTSLAEDCGERAVGIVLAGVGSDGTIGIRAIKEHGGLTLAQAEFDTTALQGMPSSAASTGLVDHVVPVEAMPAKLTDYHEHLIEVAKHKDGDGHRRDIQEHLAKITSFLLARSAHDFSGYKEATLIRRLQRRMQVLHLGSAADYVERLKTDQGEIEALFQELLIGVTQFFRDPEAFDALKAMAVMPLLSAKAEDEPIRVWVPGCSTGQEVYSIAILLREAMQARSRIPDVKIFGTDIDANAVAIARSGRYRKAAPGLPPERFAQWFAKDGDAYCPVSEIRDMCIFSTHSLVKDPPFSKLDLISCRNVLIYLDEELQDRLMRTFHYALLPGGYLFLGTAESITRNSRLFTALDKKHRIMRRRDAGATLPAFQPKGVLALEPMPSLPVRRHSADDRIDRAVGRVMQQHAPAYFVIDRNHEIIRFSGAEAGHYVEPSQGAASLNLFSIVHKSLRPAVRAAVSQALADAHAVINENLTIRIDGKARALTLIVEPIGGENGTKTGGSCVVAFRDASPTAAGVAKASKASRDANVQALERELHGTKAQLQAATDELETRIEDMKSTTEEFQAVNEELQSSNEELETSKEEMQSVNEELQTINGELNNKNELLTRLNTDVQNLLESTQIATVFLDDQLRIKHFTPSLTQLFPVRDGDRGRPITDIVTQLDYTQIRADVEKVGLDGAIVERDLVLKDSDRAFVMRMRPYRTVKNDIDGVVITFVDITEQKRAGALMTSQKEALQLLAEGAPLEEVLGFLVGVVEPHSAGGMLASIVPLNEAGTHFQRGIGASLPDAFNAAVEGVAISSPSGLCANAVTRREPVAVRDFNEDAKWRPFAQLVAPYGLQSGWSAPIVSSSGQMLGTFANYYRHTGDPTPINREWVEMVIRTAAVAIERKRAEERQAMLTRELQHRTKNLLSVIQSIAGRSLTDGRPVDEARQAFTARLHALAHAMELLTNADWQGAAVKDVVERALDTFAGRYSIEGEHVVLTPSATQGLALVVHELCTNAHKYGAFSTPGGRVAIRWSVEEDGDAARFVFRWQERGGPRVIPPEHTGFGTTLLQIAIGGTESPPHIDYAPEGLTYTFEALLAAVAAEA